VDMVKSFSLAASKKSRGSYFAWNNSNRIRKEFRRNIALCCCCWPWRLVFISSSLYIM